MPIEIKTLPAPPWRGLFLDGETPPGGMSRAENVYILPDGSAERRLYQRTLAESPECLASRSLKNVYELRKADSTRYLFADIDNSETTTDGFGAEEVTHFATWTPTAGWTYGTGWAHSAGTTALVATGETAIVPATKYRLVVGVTFPAISTAGTGWTYAHTDSGYTWISKNGNTQTVWLNTWTHASGNTTALTAAPDFTPVVGASYVISMHVTHTSGTGLTVYLGGITAGVISSTGTHEFIVRYCTDTTAFRFVPSSDWVGSINKTYPRVPNKLDNWVSVIKFINPAGPNRPSNYESTTTYRDSGIYVRVTNLLQPQPFNWYPELSAYLSQSLAVYLGGTLAGITKQSGEYSYDVTATDTTAPTFVPTTSWTGSIISASVQRMTQGEAITQTKVIGGEVTGTTDCEISWTNVLTDLTPGATIIPQWATMQDRAFRVDGTNINYYFKDASGYYTLGIPAPSDAPTTVSSTSTGELVAGTYNVSYSYVKKDGDYVVEGNPSPTSNTTITGNAIDVDVVALDDPDVTHIKIYRTLYDAEGDTPYLALEVLNANQTATLIDPDDVIGDGLTPEYNHDMPKRAMFVLTGGSRLWLLRFPGEVGGDSMMMWSSAGNPEYFPALNYQTFDPDDGDKIMGAAMMQNNILVFKRRRTWICDVYSMQSINGVSSIAKNILSPTIGCIASGSIQSVGIDQAIWLSAEGIMLYDGGRIHNISKNKINTVINSFMANGAEPYIDSVYHSTRRQYHINFLYRTGEEITSQRHFVYSMDANRDEGGVGGAWTEYVYTDPDGTRFYEINFCLASDSNMNEVILIPYLVTTTDTVTYIYQSDYDIDPTVDNPAQIIDSTGDGSTALDNPVFSMIDADENIYIASSSSTLGVNIFKIDIDGNKSLLVSNADIATATGLDDDPTLMGLYSVSPIMDVDNECFYMMGGGYTGLGVATPWILQVTLAGVCTSILTPPTEDGYYIIDQQIFELNSDGTKLYYMVQYSHNYDDPPIDFITPIIHEISDIGGSNNDNVIYSSELYERFPLGDNCADILDDYLYLPTVTYASLGGARTYSIKKINTDGTGVEETIPLPVINALPGNRDFYGFVVVSDTEMYLEVSDTPYNIHIYKISYADSAWTETLMIAIAVESSIEDSFFKRSNGDFILSYDDTVAIYSSAWALKTTIAFIDAAGICGVSYLYGSEAMESIIVACGSDTHDAWKYYPEGYWEINYDTIIDEDTEPDMTGTIANIVSNYTDLGIANDKRIKRVYLDTESQYATCGAFTLEPGYNVNVKVHEDAETSEPSGATSLRPFAHPGRQDWTYTNNQFDSTSEAWLTSRLDVGTQDKKFRYSIKVGNMPLANHGTLRIRPPMIDVQIKGKY